jgi:hypothetical protein
MPCLDSLLLPGLGRKVAVQLSQTPQNYMVNCVYYRGANWLVDS